MVIGKKYILTKNFKDEPQEDDLTLVEFEVPPVTDGEILVEAEYLSVDPYMRPYSDTMSPDITMIGTQVAKILESKNPNWPVGKKIFANIGWTTHSVFNPELLDESYIISPYILPDFDDLPASLALGMLGMPGNTAYFGFEEICKPKAGETVVVSGAAGAVGSHVGQIAKILGLKVIGIVGSEAKCKWIVDELGFDHAINYKTEDVYVALSNVAPEGVDCYFDNVGGEISSSVIHQMNEFGRISVCGSISTYNTGSKWNSNNLLKATVIQKAMIFKQLKMEGFLVYRWIDRWNEGIEKNLTWIREGKLIYKETVTEGFENMFKAFTGMLKGSNIGKAIVRV
ncbi:PREDICTED: prostaglandin reductase 1-like [Ceratosolen solmsi marchali]|uniref:Prostaglandin reductase 1 n=1 Tax=Ceratosolen solmsi marchali TaxID=326594 RepID=A0AAJ7DT07_9HYME|nr:PREDICTED: prostaglandin reductase 1-like [Ceratosolen solmsi marchali]